MSATPRTNNADGQRHRGSSNGNDRGSSEARRRRKAYLLEAYAADMKIIKVEFENDDQALFIKDARIGYWREQVNTLPLPWPHVRGVVVSAEEVPTARCYRCGMLLHMGTITVDRIKPSAHGGKYVYTNIRPACGGCNSITGGAVRRRE